MQKKSFLPLVLFLILPLAQTALAQTRIGPVIGLPMLPENMYEDSPIFGINSVTRLSPQLSLELQYQTFGANFNHEVAVPYDPGNLPRLISWKTQRRTHQFFAGMFYSFALGKNTTRLKLGANLGFEHFQSRGDYVVAADNPSGQTVETYKGTMDRLFLVPGLIFDLGPKGKNVFIQLQYGRAVHVFQGTVGNRPQEFAQFSVGIRFRVF